MIRFNRLAESIFNVAIFWVDSKRKYEYTITVNYEGCKFLIRPFIFSEIIMVSGRWEPYVKDILDNQAKEDDVLVDVGANIGIYAIPMAKKVKRVIAFEPHPKTSEILEKNIELNQLENIVLLKKIVGDHRKDVIFNLSQVPQESGIIDSRDKTMDPIVQMKCIDLDSALSTESKVDWLLIDVEGYELNVLAGAQNILRKFTPRIIFESYQEQSDAVIKVLTNEGYTVNRIFSIYYFATLV